MANTISAGSTSPAGSSFSRSTTTILPLKPLAYKKRAAPPSVIDRFEPYLRERLAAFPALTARRLFREIKERGFSGGYSVVRDRVREIRPARTAGYEVRFETPPGEQAQVDFARFEVEFADEPGVKRIVWLFSMVLGYSRLIWARSSSTRTCKASCAAISRPSGRSAARRAPSSTIA
jgi:transposase